MRMLMHCLGQSIRKVENLKRLLISLELHKKTRIYLNWKEIILQKCCEDSNNQISNWKEGDEKQRNLFFVKSYGKNAED